MLSKIYCKPFLSVIKANFINFVSIDFLVINYIVVVIIMCLLKANVFANFFMRAINCFTLSSFACKATFKAFISSLSCLTIFYSSALAVTGESSIAKYILSIVA